MRSKLGVALAAVLIVGVLGAVAWRSGLALRTDPDALWKVVHGLCAPDEAHNHLPAPCVAVDLKAAYAVLRDQRGGTQVLVIPTAKVTGIEDPSVLASGAPDYWQDAWLARAYVERLAKQSIPREDVALAINSIPGRSQNQLHIHVDCLEPEVKQLIAANVAHVGAAWTAFPEELHHHYYRALWIAGADLSAVNPFALLADGDAAARADMGHETLVAVPATSAAGAPGFVLLSDHAAAGDDAHGESLLDHRCQVLKGG